MSSAWGRGRAGGDAGKGRRSSGGAGRGREEQRRGRGRGEGERLGEREVEGVAAGSLGGLQAFNPNLLALYTSCVDSDGPVLYGLRPKNPNWAGMASFWYFNCTILGRKRGLNPQWSKW